MLEHRQATTLALKQDGIGRAMLDEAAFDVPLVIGKGRHHDFGILNRRQWDRGVTTRVDDRSPDKLCHVIFATVDDISEGVDSLAG